MREKVIGGIDEAGRGSVVGPMVVAGVAFPEHLLPRLKRIGVKDSKLLSRKRRLELERLVRKLATTVVVKIVPVSVIDRYVWRKKELGGLNKLEEDLFAEVAAALNAKVVYVDVPDVNVARFTSRLKQRVRSVEIRGSHKADAMYVVTAAASLVAKVTRDREIEKIRKLVGELGSGYPSDGKTMAFIERWITKRGEPPPFVRKSWKPVRELLGGVVESC